MRVTNNMLISNMLYNLNRNLMSMSEQQDMLASGKKVLKPSDDPVATSKILKYKTDIQELEQYDSNTEDALAWLNTTETAIEDVGDVLQRLRELGVQAASETTTTEDKQKIAEEVEQMKAQIISTGNSTFAGRYIFSGYQTDEKLFNDDGTFNIDLTDYEMNNTPITVYEIGIGETLEVSTNGLDVFGFVQLDNFFTQNVPTGEETGTEATKSELEGSFDFSGTYAVGDLDITVNGTTYSNTTALNGASFSIEKEEIIDALRESDDGGGNQLKDVADIYFDMDDNLIIKSRSYGADTLSTAGVYTAAPTSTVGTATGAATVTDASLTFTDADVAASTDNEEIFLSLNGEEQSFYIDMSTVTTVAGYVAAIQTELDSNFAPAGTITVAGVSGGALSFTSSEVSNEGEAPELAVHVKQTNESQLITDIDEFLDGLNSGDTDAISNFLGEVDDHIENLLGERADIGARSNRMELILNRIGENAINFTQLLSNAQDADMSEVIMKLKNSENVYKASLSAGAQVIQPTLMDFLG